MAQPSFKKLRRRVSYLPTFFSIALVLFLAGLFGIFLLHARKLKDQARENVQLSIYFKDDVKESDIIRIQQRLENETYVKSSQYVSKDQGLQMWQKDNGDNPEQLLGFNPFPNSIDVHFKSHFVELDSLNRLKTELEKNLSVREVTFNSYVVGNIDRNVQMVGIILLSLALLMGAVSIALIYNTIRLTLYAKRFLIKSMQLVGATQNFIRWPFLQRGLLLGLFSGILAGTLLLITLSFLTKYFPDLKNLVDYSEILLLLLVLIVVGLLITAASSYLAVSKYLKMKLDDLF